MPQRRWVYRFIALLLFLIICGLIQIGPIDASDAKQDQEPLRVATKVIEPFVFKDGDRLTGFSIDLWEEVSLLTGLPFEFVEVQSVDDQLNAVIEGKADAAIAAISMTREREENLDFSYPYYRSGLQIMTTGQSPSIFASFLSYILSSRFLIGMAGVLVILVIVGHIAWLVERKNNPDIPQAYLTGIWEGLWWAAATVTTVGYGDTRVMDKWGRLLGIFWMFAGLFLIANFTAFVTAEVTVNQLETSISGVEDLQGKRVVTVNGTTSADFLHERRIPFRKVETIEEAYELLENEDVDAIVYDAPVLQYYAATAIGSKVQVVGSPFQVEYYGIALPTNSPYEEQIDQALLEIRANGTYDELTAKWYFTEAE